VLSDHEREVLRELQRESTADPDSLQLFGRHRRHLGLSGILLITAILFLGVLMLMAGSLTGALMFGAVTWLIWWACFPSTDDPRQSP